MYITVEGPAGPSVAAEVVTKGGSALLQGPLHAPYQMELSVIRSSRAGVKVRLVRIGPGGAAVVMSSEAAVRLACMERVDVLRELEKMGKQEGG